MLYLLDSYYVKEGGIDLRAALISTAWIMAANYPYYRGELIHHAEGYEGKTLRMGKFSTDKNTCKDEVKRLIDWLQQSSISDELFTLFLGSVEQRWGIAEERPLTAFDHHDDTGAWVLNIESEYFRYLKHEFVKHGMPKDLFFPADEMFCIPMKKLSHAHKLGRMLGFEQCFTPNSWKAHIEKYPKDASLDPR